MVGVDTGSKIYYSRAFDWSGFEFSKIAVRFSNTRIGFRTFLRWIEEFLHKTEMKTVIVTCESIGCY